jgi:hypothetical protein
MGRNFVRLKSLGFPGGALFGEPAHPGGRMARRQFSGRGIFKIRLIGIKTWPNRTKYITGTIETKGSAVDGFSPRIKAERS